MAYVLNEARSNSVSEVSDNDITVSKTCYTGHVLAHAFSNRTL